MAHSAVYMTTSF